MDTVIFNTLIADGSGGEPFEGWVRLRDKFIIETGKGLPPAAEHCERLDAQGLILAPGFIDSHTHSEGSVFLYSEAENRLYQGVTTEITGNCGLSPFPVTPANREHLQKIYDAYPMPWDWVDFEGFARTVDHLRPAVNLAMLTGHNTLHAAVFGYAKEAEITHTGLEKARELLDVSLRQGSAGLSLGLLYVPGRWLTTETVGAVLAPLSKHAKVLTAHLRSEGDSLLEALEELIAFQNKTKLSKIHASHLKTSFSRNWHKIDALLKRLDEIPALTADRYPYTEAMTSLSVIAPEPFDALTDAAVQERLKSSAEQTLLLSKLKSIPPERWEEIRLCSTESSIFSPFAGQKLSEIARKLNLSHAECALQMLIEDAAHAVAAFGGMSEANMKRIAEHGKVCCGSDENMRNGSEGKGGHPRGFGSFPRFFQTARINGIGEAVRKMTALPAQIYGLPKRGRIAVGMIADLTLFNPEKMISKADFVHPCRLSEGVRDVWVGGVRALADGVLTGERAGKVLRA